MAPKDLLVQIKTAIGFLTVLRIPSVGVQPDDVLAKSTIWFPIIGLIIGAIAYATGSLATAIFSHNIGAITIVTFLSAVSGGLHLDGLADTADGMATPGDKADKLGVMSAGNTGPAGSATLIMVLRLQWAVIAEILQIESNIMRFMAITGSVLISRWTAIPMSAFFRPARLSGLGKSMQLKPKAPITTIGLSIGLVLISLLVGWSGIVFLVVGLLSSTVVCQLAARQIGGITGDVLGASIEISLTVTLLLFLFVSMQTDFIPSPLWG